METAVAAPPTVTIRSLQKSYEFGIAFDLASGHGTPFGIAAGFDPWKRGQARDSAKHCIRVATALGAPCVYLDVGKFHGSNQAPRLYRSDGLLKMKAEGVPFALEFEEAFEELMLAFPTVPYTGWAADASWPAVYKLFPHAVAVGQDYTGTAKGAAASRVLEANKRKPTLVEGPADPGPDGEKLLALGCILPTSSWWALDRANKHARPSFSYCNRPERPDFIDLEWSAESHDFEGLGGKLHWGSHWAGQCRAAGLTPVFSPYSRSKKGGLVDVSRFRSSLAPAPPRE